MSEEQLNDKEKSIDVINKIILPTASNYKKNLENQGYIFNIKENTDYPYPGITISFEVIGTPAEEEILSGSSSGIGKMTLSKLDSPISTGKLAFQTATKNGNDVFETNSEINGKKQHLQISESPDKIDSKWVDSIVSSFISEIIKLT